MAGEVLYTIGAGLFAALAIALAVYAYHRRRVDGGPPPPDFNARLARQSLAEGVLIPGTFSLDDAPQGPYYWAEVIDGKELTPEARSILERWIEISEMEAMQ